MSGPRAGNGAIVLDPDEQQSPCAVREVDHCLDQVTVLQRAMALSLELNLE